MVYSGGFSNIFDKLLIRAVIDNGNCASNNNNNSTK